MRKKLFLFWVLSFFIIPQVEFSGASPRVVTIDVKMDKPIFAGECIECHEEDVDPAKYADSVHGANACTSCHEDIIDLEKHAEGKYIPLPPKCGKCHKKEAREYRSSVHFIREKFTCTDCHEDIHYLQPWRGMKVRIIEKCTSCHEEENYVISGHAQAVLKGNNDSAVCSDCHGLHDTRVLHTAGRKYPVEARQFYTRACYKCHADKELMKRNNLTTIAVETYEHSVHGKIQKLGYPAAGCADCHTSHNILPKDDTRSTIHPKNLVKVCSRCHEGVNANFIKFIAHPDLRNWKKYPQLFWATVLMTALLIVVLLFFWGHTFLWWRKAYWEKQRLLAEGHLISDKLAQIENPGETYIRFKVRDRVLHLIGIFSFFGLASTGLPLKFPDAPWSRFLLSYIGGVPSAVLIHRICAFVLIVIFLVILAYCFHFIFLNRNAGSSWKERLSGPYSLLPRKKDWDDFVNMVKWFVDQGPPPKFDHWTYWEKFDFLAVFWGMAAIGISGIIMWWPQVTTKFLPGWVINVARVVHSEEALLAIGFIFTVHFFNTHFIPTKWPMNYSIFTGRIYKWEFVEERPLEYERLAKEGKLERLKAPFPNILANFFSGAVGLSALLIGLFTVILIIWAFFE